MVSVSSRDNPRRHRPPKKNQAERLDPPGQSAIVRASDMTAARSGHVEAPTFRNPSTLARAAAGPNSTSTEPAAIPALLHESARTAREGAERLLDAAVRIAGCYRRCELIPADRDFSDLVTALRTLTRVTALLVTVGGTVESRNRLDVLAGRLCEMFDTIAVDQTKRRWDAVADVLDGELAPALDQWSTILDALYTEVQLPASAEAAGVAS
jgi:hypothetical protein